MPYLLYIYIYIYIYIYRERERERERERDGEIVRETYRRIEYNRSEDKETDTMF